MCFLLNFVATPSVTILESLNVVNDADGIWLWIRIVVAILFTAGGIAWVIAA